MFESIPNTLVAYIFEFLSFKDFVQISLTSKRLSQIICEHKKFWTRECLNQYISFDLGTYSEIYDFEEFQMYIREKSLIAQKLWHKNLMIEGSKCRKSFANALAHFSSQERVDDFMVSYYETLKQPLLPLANLKRETIISTTQTIFQNKLSEVLYEDAGMGVKKLSFPSESEEFISELLNFEEKILKDAPFCDKDSFAKARWYSFDQEQSQPALESPKLKNVVLSKDSQIELQSKSLDSTNDELQNVKNNASCLIEIYHSICRTQKHFCSVISHYLNSLDNIYDLIAEYTSRWNAYVCTMLELEQTFKAFSELMNKTYEDVFKGHPSFPKFSIWRLLTKIWMKEVFEKSNLNFSLNDSFLRILGNHRDKNIKQSLNANFCNLRFEESKNNELPKCLFVNLKMKNKKKSTLQYQNANQYQNIIPPCIEANREFEKQILHCFMQSILDLSLNEVNIHYLDCTEIPTNSPYQEVEEAFLMKSNEFYNDYQQIFTESPDYFCHFLKADCSFISQILPQRTNIKLEQMLIECGLQFSKEFVNNQFDCIKQDQFEKFGSINQGLSDHGVDQLNDFIEAFLSEIHIEHSQPKPANPCSNFYSLPQIDFEDLEDLEGIDCPEIKENEGPIYCKYPDSKIFIKKLSNYFFHNYLYFRSNFEYFQQRLEEFKRIQENDKQIKEINLSKNIPCEMGDVDRLFYDLDKNVDLVFLQKLSEDYSNFLNEEDKNNGLDILSEGEPNVQNLNGLDDMNLDQNLVDLDNLDLLIHENLSLRRAPF